MISTENIDLGTIGKEGYQKSARIEFQLTA